MQKLNDGDLFRQTCLIDSVWQAAAGGATVPVVNPATAAIRVVPSWPAPHRAEQAR